MSHYYLITCGGQGLSLVYTGVMWDLLRRRRHRHIAARLLGLVLLVGVFGLTSMPVCGSALDVDPIACCEHHGCGQSTKSCPSTRHLQKSQQGGCCSISEGACDTGSGAERCCELGQLTHPNAKLQASASATHVLNVFAAFTILSLALPQAASHSFSLYPEASLRVPSLPLYTLTATYRI